MRIGFDAHVLDGRNQGTKTALLRILGEIAPAFSQHDFLVYSDQPHPELDFGHANLHFRHAPRTGVSGYLLCTMPKAVKSDALDVMVFNYVAPPFLRRSAVVIHDVLPQTHPRFFPRRFVAQCWILFGASTIRARHVFSVSEYSRRELRRIYPWMAKRSVDVLHQGPSFPTAAYQATTPTTTSRLGDLGQYILCVGRIEPRKNMQMAVDAFQRGAPADVRLVLVGRREPGVMLDLGDDPRIVEVAGLSDEELATLYRGAALFLYPSAAEGFGIPLLDAILFGVPVISSDRTSMPEVGGDCAVFFDPGAAKAGEWLAGRIAGHFGADPVLGATPDQRRERASVFGWNKAARELVAGLER